MPVYAVDAGQLLSDVISQLRETSGPQTKNEALSVIPLEQYWMEIEGDFVKQVYAGSAAAAFSNEVLTGSGYGYHMPVLIRDCLNGYSMQIYLHPKDGMTSEQESRLGMFPDGILNFGAIKGTKNNFRLEDLVRDICEIRNDVIGFEVLEVPTGDGTYRATYAPRTDSVYILPEGQGIAYKAQGFSRKIDIDPMILVALRDACRVDVRQTFFV